MEVFRSKIGIAALVLAGAAVCALLYNAGPALDRLAAHWRQTPEEIAADIARVIETSTAKTPGAPVTFVSAMANSKTVEMSYFIGDSANFERVRANADTLRAALIPSVCKKIRPGAFERGVVVLIVYKGPAGERVETTIDQAACANPPRTPVAEGVLAGMAQLVANLENENKDAKNKALARVSFAPFRFAGATVREGGVVENRYVAGGAELTLGIPAAYRAEIEKLFKESSCNSQLVFIQNGGAIHHLIVRGDGSSLMRFTVNKSAC